MTPTRPVHRIAEGEPDGRPVFPCWLWKAYPMLSDEPLWLYMLHMPEWCNDVRCLAEAGGYTYWSPDAPTPPPQQPGQEGAKHPSWRDLSPDQIVACCHSWLWRQMRKENCVTTAMDIFEDLQFYADNLDKFTASVFDGKLSFADRDAPQAAPSTAGMSGGEPPPDMARPRDADNCPVELAVLRREWNEQRSEIAVMGAECSRLQQALQRAEGELSAARTNLQSASERDATNHTYFLNVLHAVGKAGFVGSLTSLHKLTLDEIASLRASLTGANERIATLNKQYDAIRSQLAQSEEVRKQLAGACAKVNEDELSGCPANTDPWGTRSALAASEALDKEGVKASDKAPPFDPAAMPHDHDHMDDKQ